MSNKLEQTIQRLLASKSDEEVKQVYVEWQSIDCALCSYAKAGLAPLHSGVHNDDRLLSFCLESRCQIARLFPFLAACSVLQ